ncbi:endonuclease/exonuclease/phosphatase family protein [Rhizobium sp. CNPSo 3464]|uniref:endonuclease/exonuclease/phosphatase family protein n=1 Tax=Rhizobium sp. CNPSo 3464 TaxID=3021406 RepID=UPI00254E1A66|nr:endonuclease/exonuclease/phosphatase family protein [Rhizobium sp. CNPSo 3464]MDK4739380.1 endonuclease/exonuclease/phosphatase family protein [Rhizobium sp. CNPSo 3464]
MKLASYNIQCGFGLDERYDLERIVGNLAGADIIALQEVTRGFVRNGRTDMVAAIEALLPDYYSIYGTGLDLLPPGAGPRDLRFQFGNMVLSRWPILATRTLLLPRSRTLSKLNLQRVAVEAVIDAPGGAVRVYSVHLDHVSPDERIRQIHYLKDRAINFVRDGGSLTGAVEIDFDDPPLPEDFILMGDFNMVPESPEYCALAGLKDAFYGRMPRFDVPTDALDVVGALKPEAYSWMDPKDRNKRMHLDYCFISCGLSDRLRSAHVDIDAEGSDHFPVWVEIDG